MGNGWILVAVLGFAALCGVAYFTSRIDRALSQQQFALKEPPGLTGGITKYSNTATYNITFSQDFRSMKVVVHKDAKMT